MKYNQGTQRICYQKIQRVSKPGLRKYAGAKEMPRVLNGLGIAIVSTSHGVMTDKASYKRKCRWRSIMLRLLKRIEMSRIGKNPITIPEGVNCRR